MRGFLKNHNVIALVFILFVTCLLFFKIFSKGLYPIPADLLVSFYFPWYSGGWEGYNPWTTHKELLGADAIRQIYLWKEFAMQEFKSGNLPTWNPYTFSGQPLLANFQSSVFYPLNIFYFIVDSRNAWLLLVISQPLLAGIFMYFCARSFKLSAHASSFAAVAFMFSSYLITWMENGNIGTSYIWFPASIWAINNFTSTKKLRFLLFLVMSLSLSIFGGHPQTAIYLYLTIVIYWIFKSRRQWRELFAAVFGSIAIASLQIIPTLEFYKNSPISLPFSKDVFDRAILPAKNLITFFASDFYGHPANNNFWSQSYGDFTPYFGVIPLMLSFWAIFRFWKEPVVKFVTVASAFFILAATHGPITYLIKTLQIPILDSTTPSRFVSISIFLLIILAAFGFEDFIKNFQDKKFATKFVKFTLLVGIVYLLLWLFAISGSNTNLAVTRRNLILPTLMFLTLPVGVALAQIAKNKSIFTKYLKTGAIISIFIVTLVGGIYFSNKFLPVAPKNYIFPDHLLFDWLSENAGINRFHGSGTAHIDFNFPTHYQVYGAEGYDTTRLERYAQLLASAFSGKVPETYLRSDGVFPNEENGYRKRLFELLGVKYLLDKEDNPKTGADWHYERFPGDDVRGIWQDGKFQVFERQPVLPRAFLTTKYIVAQNDNEIIEKIYDQNFDLQTLILEKEPAIKIENNPEEITIPELVKYDPSSVMIKTNSDHNTLLYLSDAYDPNWKVAVDNQPRELLRAHYALRAVAVPAGYHQVTFRYQPRSTALGATITAFSSLVLAVASLYFVRKKKF